MRLLLILLILSLSGCTVIRYVDPEENNTTNNGETPPRVVDMLVMVDMSRSSATLSNEYFRILGFLTSGLASQRVEVRKMALAPLDRRIGQTVPLIYGTDDANAEFGSPAQALVYYAKDGGTLFLTDEAESDFENLALLGPGIATQSIYRANGATQDGRPYFTAPEDGLIVVTLSPSARICGAADENCFLDNQPAADFLLTETSEGAAWLDFPGDKELEVSKVFHVVVATQEGQSDFQAFSEHCRDFAGFPSGTIDLLEPSALTYFGPTVERINDGAGRALFIDLCEGMSELGEIEVGKAVVEIRRGL